MKKFILVLILLIAIAAGCIYLLIPSTIVISRSINISASDKALMRKLGRAEDWNEWWPGNKNKNDILASYPLDGFLFTPGAPKPLSVPLTIDANHFTTSAELTLIGKTADSTTVNLETRIISSSDPFKRVNAYYESKKLQKAFDDILVALKKGYSATATLYGFEIRKEKVKDSILVSTFKDVQGYPSIDKIYSLIDQLRDYAKANNATVTGYPMLNIYNTDTTNYVARVALPVDKKLPTSGNISYKWMLGGGNILVTDVKGGQQEIDRAYKRLSDYVSDYSRTAPAISFQSLVTDRRAERDSSKWVTKIYYPVM